MWMAQAREMRMWDAVAWTCLHAGSTIFSKRRIKFEELHPMRHRSAKTRIDELLAQREKFRKILPKKLTEEEKLARWRKFTEAGGKNGKPKR